MCVCAGNHFLVDEEAHNGHGPPTKRKHRTMILDTHIELLHRVLLYCTICKFNSHSSGSSQILVKQYQQKMSHRIHARPLTLLSSCRPLITSCSSSAGDPHPPPPQPPLLRTARVSSPGGLSSCLVSVHYEFSSRPMFFRCCCCPSEFVSLQLMLLLLLLSSSPSIVVLVLFVVVVV